MWLGRCRRPNVTLCSDVGKYSFYTRIFKKNGGENKLKCGKSEMSFHILLCVTDSFSSFKEYEQKHVIIYCQAFFCNLQS